MGLETRIQLEVYSCAHTIAIASSIPKSSRFLLETLKAGGRHYYCYTASPMHAINLYMMFKQCFSDLNSHHFEVVTYLRDLDRQQICDLGGALGLTYSNLEKMRVFPDDMVAAWLRREDSVISVSGEPTWRRLVQALKRVGQGGVANKIETSNDVIRK